MQQNSPTIIDDQLRDQSGYHRLLSQRPHIDRFLHMEWVVVVVGGDGGEWYVAHTSTQIWQDCAVFHLRVTSWLSRFRIV